MGDPNAGRTGQPLSGRRGGIRLVARRFAARIPYDCFRRPAFRFRRHAASSGTTNLYLERAAEFDWSLSGSRLAYHTTASGAPLFVSDGPPQPQRQPIFTAPAG